MLTIWGIYIFSLANIILVLTGTESCAAAHGTVPCGPVKTRPPPIAPLLT